MQHRLYIVAASALLFAMACLAETAQPTATWPSATSAWAYALLPTERTHNVAEEEAVAFRSAILNELVDKGIRVLDRAQVADLLREADLAAALSPEEANRAYRSIRLSADVLLVAGICKVGSDYILTLRQISADGRTTACGTRNTRLSTEFRSLVRELITTQFAAPSVGVVESEQALPQRSRLREICIAQGTHTRFPELWKRIQAIEDAAGSSTRAGVDHYYAWILELTAMSASPPQGMLFIPGGWVSVKGPRGPIRIGVEPFYMDGHRVTVARYETFLKTLPPGTEREQHKPIAARGASTAFMSSPLTGVTWKAARAYAGWQGKQLPSDAQWQRALAFARDMERDTRAGAGGQSSDTIPAAERSSICWPEFTSGAREWTSTWDGPYEIGRGGVVSEPSDGSLKIIRGGGEASASNSPIMASRAAAKPGEAFADVGFRCVRHFFRSVARCDDPDIPWTYCLERRRNDAAASDTVLRLSSGAFIVW